MFLMEVASRKCPSRSQGGGVYIHGGEVDFRLESLADVENLFDGLGADHTAVWCLYGDELIEATKVSIL